jgi:hypothetical protein
MSDKEGVGLLNAKTLGVGWGTEDASAREEFWKREVVEKFSGKGAWRWRCLWGTNAVAFALHLVSGVVVLVEGFGGEVTYYEELWTLRGLWLDANMTAMSSVSPAPAAWSRVPLAAPCAAFALISAFFHGLVIVGSWGGPTANKDARSHWYYESLARCFVWWRWLEYALSAPVMLFAMQTAAGIREIGVLCLTFFSQSSVMLCGLLTERYSRIRVELLVDGKRGVAVQWERRSWAERLIPFFLGCYLYVPGWVVFFATFYRNAEDSASATGRGAPDFVYGIVWGEFVVFSLFTLPILWGQWRDPREYWWTELAYSVLSLLAKLLLNSLLLINVFRMNAGSARV